MKFLLFLCCVVGALCAVDNNPREQAEKVAALISNRMPDHSGHGAVHNAICTGCEDLFKEVNTMLSNPDIVEKVKAALRNVCSYMGGAEEDCVNLVDDDLESLIHQLQGVFANPKQLCEELKMCISTPNTNIHFHKILLMYSRRWVHNFKTKPTNAILCDECEFMVGELKRIFNDKATQQEIKQYLEDSCTTLGSLEDQCKKLIDENFGVIVMFMDSVLDKPKEVCAEIGLCSANRLPMLRRFINHYSNIHAGLKESFHKSKIPKTHLALSKIRNHELNSVPGGCIACKFAFDTLTYFLESNNATIMAIVDLIGKICTKLPSDVNEQCTDWLNIYGPPVVVMTMKTYLQADAICQDLTACSSSQLSVIQEFASRPPALKGEAFCVACKEVISLTKRELGTQAVKKELDDALIKAVCDKINPQYKPNCDNVINGYIPQVWQVVDDAINPDEVCKAIKACT